MNKCLNCGREIGDKAEVCSVECSEEYFRYVFGEELKDHPEFKTKIEGDKEIMIEICETLGCGDKAEYQCIENQEKYCRNCKILMNVNGAGMEIDDYHFKKMEK